MNQPKNQIGVDFAISYAGEEKAVAKEIDTRLRELDFNVFFADRNRPLLLGADGEIFFERMFSEAKQVVVLISKNYKSKPWTRFEWDVIQKRENINRFIPVRIDDTPIVGLPSNIIYFPFNGDNYQEIVDACVEKLLIYEQAQGITRPSEYETFLTAIKSGSKGATARAYQLVKDKRTRSPLDDCEIPQGMAPAYRVVDLEWVNVSVVKRLSIKVIVPKNSSREAVLFNLKYCAASHFNAYKPDALMVFGYFDEGENTDTNFVYTAGRVEFAPFGDWERAEEGVAYNIPTSEFEFSVDLAG